MSERQRPSWGKHWPRYDGVYRTQRLHKMWIVVDTGLHYQVLRYEAIDCLAPPTVEAVIEYSAAAFSTACSMAKGLAQAANLQQEVKHVGS
jgi:hypothetical protein